MDVVGPAKCGSTIKCSGSSRPCFEFDGTESPPGFAAVVLIDESHVSAHCYAEEGILAVDCFTCGGVNPNQIADDIHQQILIENPGICLVQRTEIERFVSD